MQARNLTTNVQKILDLKLSSEQVVSKNCRWVPLMYDPCTIIIPTLHRLIWIAYDKPSLLFVLPMHGVGMFDETVFLVLVYHPQVFE